MKVWNQKMSQLGLWKFLITVLFVFTVLVTVIKIGTELKRLLEWLLDLILVGTKSWTWKGWKQFFQFPKWINYWTNESIIDFKIILNLEFRRALFRVFDPLGLRVCTPFLIRVQRAKSSLTAVLGISCLKSSEQWHWKTRVNTLIMIPCVPYVWIMG